MHVENDRNKNRCRANIDTLIDRYGIQTVIEALLICAGIEEDNPAYEKLTMGLIDFYMTHYINQLMEKNHDRAGEKSGNSED